MKGDYTPYEMDIEISDAKMWLDTEINGFQRLRFPVTLEYTIWKDNKTETGTREYDGYLLFKLNEEQKKSDDAVLFGEDTGGLWFNFYNREPDRAQCSFSSSDSSGNVDTEANNRFYCERTTPRKNTNTWNKFDSRANFHQTLDNPHNM